MSVDEKGFWAVVTKNNRSAWEWKSAACTEARGSAYFSTMLCFGPTEFKEEEPRDWNNLHGCPTHYDTNLQIFRRGKIEVRVGNVVRTFGPGQKDGDAVAFLDVLERAYFPDGHQTRVIEATEVVVIKFNRGPSGD